MTTDNKVSRIIKKYDLTGMEDRLETAWTGELGERSSLRELADEFNRAVLRESLVEARVTTIEEDVETTYHILTSDDVSGADRTRKERELETNGINVEEIKQDFVSHQTIHTYLTEHRDVELPDTTVDLVDRKLSTIEKLVGRTEAVLKSTLSQLQQNGELTNREYEVLVNVTFVCTDCGSDYTARDLLQEGGCNCE